MTVVAVNGPPANLDPLGAALGVLFEPYPAACAMASLSIPTQDTFGVAVYATQAAVVTGIKLRNGTAAAGTLPTSARVGLADSTGKMLVLSANLNALASWPAGVCTMPFTAQLALPYTGLYFACVNINGAWSVTQPTPNCVSGATAVASSADGALPAPYFLTTVQADLPAVGASVTTAGGNTGRAYYLALY